MSADLFAGLLPSSFQVVVSSTADLVDTLLGAERAAVAHATPARRREYAAGRRCARQALTALGHPNATIPTGPHRSPVWPAGTVGSITHCDGVYAAVAGSTPPWRSVGIDAEPLAPLPAGVASLVASPLELGSPSPAGGPTADVAAFCVKEAIFKAWWPITRRWLGFFDVTLDLRLSEQEFRAQVTIATGPSEPREFSGRVGWTSTHIGAAVAVPCP